jgi:predicted PurR-regulated permease PerM
MNRLLKPAAGFHFSTVFVCSILLSHGFSHVVQKLKHARLFNLVHWLLNVFCRFATVFLIIYRSENDQQGEAIDYGPSIYTVNEQYIKPITAAAGKMSWALMMHPLGLDCDLFL